MRRLVGLVLGLGLFLVAAVVPPRAGDVVPWQGTFQRVAGARWVDRAAQAEAESAFDPQAVSKVGAKGILQFMPGTWDDALRKRWAPPGSVPTDPEAAIPAGHAYMNWLEPFCGGFEAGLGGFNAGPGWIRKARALARDLGMPGERAWLDTLPRFTGKANARQTRDYLTHNAVCRARIRSHLMAQSLARPS